MAATDPIRNVLVAGGGITAFSAAAALRSRLPHLAVAILATPPSPAALAERVTATLPSILEFHRDIGLDDANAILRAGGSFRIGSLFEGWCEERPSFVHAYGQYGRPFGTASFHHHWLRQAKHGRAAPFDAFSPAAAMALAGRFVPPPADPETPLGSYGIGLELDLGRYLEMLQAYARHLGIPVREGRIAAVLRREEDGGIAALRLEDGSEASADLFVDCTGPEALLRSALDDRFEDWSRWLPCDRVLLAQSAPAAEPSTLERVTARAHGWTWRSEGLARTGHGFAYASHLLPDEAAAATLRAASGQEPAEPPFAIRRGRRPQPWMRNCVAIGDAAVCVDPLEWTGLHLVHSAIDRIVTMMPDRDFSPVELWDYNRQCAAEADRVRDFIALHYLAARRPEPFWQEAAAAEPPASLAHTLALFRERGRLPFHEEETFARDSWLAILFGLGVMPRRPDPLIETSDPARSEEAMKQMRAATEQILPTLPTQAQFLRNLTRQTA